MSHRPIETIIPITNEAEITKLIISEEQNSTKPITNELIINDHLPGLVRGQGTVMLIDVSNLYHRAEAEGFKIDYVKLKTIFANRCDLRHCSVFSPIDPNDHTAKEWLYFLSQNGITPITKDIKKVMVGEDQWIHKGNMDVELTIEAMTLSEGFAHVIIGSCDGDFVPLIEELRKDRFKTVSVMGISNHNQKGMSEELAKAGHHFYDLRKLKPYISMGSV